MNIKTIKSDNVVTKYVDEPKENQKKMPRKYNLNFVMENKYNA